MLPVLVLLVPYARPLLSLPLGTSFLNVFMFRLSVLLHVKTDIPISPQLVVIDSGKA